MRLILVRHAATEFNERRLVQGQLTDLPLSPLGEKQAGQLAEVLSKEPIVTIYSSPLARALQTAHVIATQFGGVVFSRVSLQEINVGDCEDWPIDTLQNAFPPFWNEWQGDGDVQWPGGEKVSDVFRRASSFLEEVKERHPNDTIAIVTHATPAASILALGLGLPIGGYRQLWLDVGHYSILETQGRTDGYPCGARGMSLKGHNFG